jgi:cytoskeletal protein CcmA (bactofilin family)
MAILPRDKPTAAQASGPHEPLRGVVAAVAAMQQDKQQDKQRESDGASRHAGIVDRVFGPGQTSRPEADPGERPSAKPLYPEIDVDFSLGEVARKLASVLGPASKVAGDLVADENIEIQGLVEGCVRARRSRVTVAREGLVQSRIEARSVRVQGTVRGNVSAQDWVEVKAGGVIRGDVRAPRVILHDGAIVTGRLDMSGANIRRRSTHFDPLVIQPRPRMRKVARATEPAKKPAG